MLQLPDRSLKWSVQWCLTVPIGISYPVGVPAVTLSNNKVLFMVRRQWAAMAQWVEPWIFKLASNSVLLYGKICLELCCSSSL